MEAGIWIQDPKQKWSLHCATLPWHTGNGEMQEAPDCGLAHHLLIKLFTDIPFLSTVQEMISIYI